MTQSLIQKSQHLQNSADLAVKNTNIVKLLETIGKIEFVGSYALGLLYRPDIDLFVLDKDCSKDNAIAMTKQLIDSDVFQTVGFANGSLMCGIRLWKTSKPLVQLKKSWQN